MPAKPLTDEQRADAARLKEAFKAWQARMRGQGTPVSQDAAAALLGFGQSALSQYLNGAIPLNSEVLRKIAKLIGIRPVEVSPTIVEQAQQRSAAWGNNEAAMAHHVRALLTSFGARVSEPRSSFEELPDWLSHAFGAGSDYVPDLVATMADGAKVWVEIKSPHVEAPRQLQQLERDHPEEFLLLHGSEDLVIARASEWLMRRSIGLAPSAHQVKEPEPEYRQPMRNRRPVWVVGQTQGGMTERIWTDGDYPVGELEEWADVSTTDEHAFACRVVGDSMVPRYMPGEYALVEPGTPPELEDDVLVRLATGETMLKRLLSRRGGIRLGSYNSQDVINLREDEVTWMYYVAHPIPTRRIRQRVDMDAHQEVDRRVASSPVAVEQRRTAWRLGDDQPESAPLVIATPSRQVRS